MLEYTCLNIPDHATFLSDITYLMAMACRDGNVMVTSKSKPLTNTLSKIKTHKKGDKWVSERDVCPTSPDLISNIDLFPVDQT